MSACLKGKAECIQMFQNNLNRTLYLAMKGGSRTPNRSSKSKAKGAGNETDSPSFKVPLPKARPDSTAPVQTKPESPRIAKLSKSMHSRSSSVNSIKRGPQPDPNSKPPSQGATFKPPSIKRPTTPDDDTVSVAESCKSKSGKVRRSEAERIQYLKNDPTCGDIEPFRAFCKKCNKRLSLGRRTTYSLGFWLKHRERCDKNAEQTDGESAEERNDTADPLPVPPSTSQSEDSELTDTQMRAILEMDPRAEVVESQRMRCKKCRKWVKLGTVPRYGGIIQWLIHQMRCHRALQGSDAADAARVAMMQVLRLGKDSQALTFTFGMVECDVCGEHVPLDPDRDYDLTRWEEHKRECPKISTEVDGDASSVRPPPSSASASPVPANPDTPTRTGKRQRSEDDDDDTEPRRNRPRNEANEESGGPGALGWILHPFRMFVRGFREGMQGSPS